ncbi:hypothetical protein SLEP1_g39557 [Rubroshorea leprosula]|uniref:Uncharacterized protein n=1 Tax=Rubroshorea leprosula TaxID=152421 RepID=A0AAV5L1R1_9ROSI|nr:hypothetical protein SLEP1_g39557 [Rubroshorea leprosula]
MVAGPNPFYAKSRFLLPVGVVKHWYFCNPASGG